MTEFPLDAIIAPVREMGNRPRELFLFYPESRA